jgi:hypothetical protein
VEKLNYQQRCSRENVNLCHSLKGSNPLGALPADVFAALDSNWVRAIRIVCSHIKLPFYRGTDTDFFVSLAKDETVSITFARGWVFCIKGVANCA